MALPDRGYANLLSHLYNGHSSLPMETVQVAITHYLVRLPPPHLSPSPLIATIISSQLWHPLSFPTLAGLASAFRRAVHFKYSALETDTSGLFSNSRKKSLSNWVKNVLDGLQNGDAVLRLAISGGLLLGLDDIKLHDRRNNVEEELVIAFAEVLDAKPLPKTADDNWETEFRPGFEGTNERLGLALLLASQYFPFVAENALSTLRLTLSALADLCLSTIRSVFRSGRFIKDSKSFVAKDKFGRIFFEPTSYFVANLETMLSSDEFQNVGPFSKLLSQTISISSNKISPSRRLRTWETLKTVTDMLIELTVEVEDGWRESVLAFVNGDDDIATESREITTKLWTVLKTLLFSTVMLAQAVLSTIVFLPPPDPGSNSAAELSMSVLETLSHLSFVISKFGGVTVAGQSQNGNEDGFKELKRAFYTALDVLSADARQSEKFVRILMTDFHRDTGQNVRDRGLNLQHPFRNAKRAYALACVEQLVPVLSEVCIERYVLPMCEPHLENASHRETFESAHSVMLSIFAAHASAKPKHVHLIDRKTDKGKRKDEDIGLGEGHLARRLVPGYAKCLLDSSKEGRLSTAQLRLAYAALVRSASVNGGAATADGMENGYVDEALAWLCIDGLLTAIRSTISGQITDEDMNHRHKLILALISLVPNVSMVLLPHVFREVEGVIRAENNKERKDVLIDALFEEILTRVGDGEKDYAMRWWHEHVVDWVSGPQNAVDE